jgi:MFS superfamily sulfate permease-like transporter
LSGLTVALALIPEAVAFAFVAHVEPMVGLYAAFIMGLITALIGGQPGMISGATGAMAVVMVSLVIEHGEAAFTDLAFAVFVGVIVSTLVFAWQHAKHINIDIDIDISEDTNGWTIYRLNGPLFFGSVANSLELFDAENNN